MCCDNENCNCKNTDDFVVVNVLEYEKLLYKSHKYDEILKVFVNNWEDEKLLEKVFEIIGK